MITQHYNIGVFQDWGFYNMDGHLLKSDGRLVHMQSIRKRQGRVVYTIVSPFKANLCVLASSFSFSRFAFLSEDDMISFLVSRMQCLYDSYDLEVGLFKKIVPISYARRN